MIGPMVAPAVGAGITAFTSWRAIFMLFAVMAALMLVWLRRLPETLAPADVRPLDWRTMLAGWGTVTRHRRAAGYMIASGLMQAARSEEHTSELQSLMRISYAVFCLK